MRLKPFAWFAISLSTAAAIARRVVADAAQVPVRTQDFAWLTALAGRHTAQAFQVECFFALSARGASANCLRFAATRLKFAARLVNPR
jgi:hypothetical protein